MVVWALPTEWDPNSVLPEDATYGIITNPTNAQLVNNYGFPSPAPPPAGVITVSTGGAAGTGDPGTFYYVPPGATVSVCTNGTTESEVAIHPINLSAAVPMSCSINGTNHTYSGDPYDFIGDGNTPPTACAEMNCVHQIGQVPVWEHNTNTTWGEAYNNACYPTESGEIQSALTGIHVHLLNETNQLQDPPAEFAPFFEKYLDRSNSTYIGATSSGIKNEDEIAKVINECPFLEGTDWLDKGRFSADLKDAVNAYRKLINQSAVEANGAFSPYLTYARVALINAVAGPDTSSGPSRMEYIWAARSKISNVLGNVDGALTAMLATSGIDLNSPLGTAILEAIPDGFSWPFNVGEQNYYVDTSRSDDLGTLWEDVRGIVKACAYYGDALNTFDDLINGDASEIDLPDWTPHITDYSGVDLDQAQEQLSTLGSCAFASGSSTALATWQQSIGVVASHMLFQESVVATGGQIYATWMATLQSLESNIPARRLAFINANVSDASAMATSWENTPASEVLASLVSYRLDIADTASASELAQLDTLISTLSLAPQQSVGWLLQALGVLGINPLSGSGEASAIDMLMFGCSLQEAIEAADAHVPDDGGGVGPESNDNGTTVSGHPNCYGLVASGGSDSISSSASTALKRTLGKGKVSGKRTKNTFGVDSFSIAQQGFGQGLPTLVSGTSLGSSNEEDCFPPTDPHLAEQWYLNDADAGVNHTSSPVNRQIIIGMLDDGINTLHEDLTPNLWTNTGELVDGIDNDNNGCVDDIHGCNIADMTGAIHRDILPDGTFPDGHGTAVAGVMIAEPNNDVGIRGINPDALLITAVLNTATDPVWAKALEYVINNGANIVNISYAAIDNPAFMNYLHAVMAQHPEVLFVVGAANDGFNVEYSTSTDAPLASLAPFTPFYEEAPIPFTGPWLGRLPNLIVVSSIDKEAMKAHNYGSRSVDLYAPGVDILTTYYGEQAVRSASGTSLAAPIVAAAASLIMQADPTLTAADTKKRLLSSVSELSKDIRATVTGGRLNIQAALQPTPASRLHLTPQEQLVHVIPGRTDNRFPLHLFNTGQSAPTSYALSSIDSRLTFDTSTGTVPVGEQLLVTGQYDATGLDVHETSNSGVSAGGDEWAKLKVKVAGTEIGQLPDATGVELYETGKLLLQYDGRHVIASTGPVGNRSLLVYAKSADGFSYNFVQSLPCNVHCAAGLHQDSILVADPNNNQSVKAYAYDNAAGTFVYSTTVNLTVQDPSKPLRRLEVGVGFAAVAGFEATLNVPAVMILIDADGWVNGNQTLPGSATGRFGSDMDIEDDWLVIAGSVDADNKDILRTYRYSPGPVFPMDFGVAILKLPGEATLNSSDKMRLDVSGDYMVVTKGAEKGRLLWLYKKDNVTPTGLFTWNLYAQESLNTSPTDYSPRESTGEVHYSVVLNGTSIKVGIAEDSRFSYAMGSNGVRRGAGAIQSFDISPPTVPGGAAVILDSIFHGATDLQAGDGLGWSFSEAVDGAFISSRPRSESVMVGPGVQNTGDLLRYFISE